MNHLQQGMTNIDHIKTPGNFQKNKDKIKALRCYPQIYNKQTVKVVHGQIINDESQLPLVDQILEMYNDADESTEFLLAKELKIGRLEVDLFSL